MWYSNEHYYAEIESARGMIEEDISTNTEDMLRWFDVLSEQEKSSVSKVLSTSRTHSEALEDFSRDHSQHVACTEQYAIDLSGKNTRRDYEPTGTTPIRRESDIPSNDTIESLRAMPMKALGEEFRENNLYESFHLKEPKATFIPRPPLSQIN
ncbi:hypothetical protein OROGR_029588 [Orobanche gracilis]